MRVDLTSEEVEMLQRVLEGRRHEMLMEIAHTDSRDYRVMLSGEEDLLKDILAKLGGIQPEGSLETSRIGE